VAAESDRREKIVEDVAGHVLAHGLARTSLRELAAAAGTSDRMLLYYFPDKAALMAALDAQRAPGPLPAAALLERLSAQAEDAASWPFLQLWLELAARAGRGDPDVREVAHSIGTGFLDWVSGQLDAPDEGSRQVTAREVLAAVEGRIVLKAVGV
jgi:AcrR family transcriptional regulator